jgi:hypothetical protein
MRVVVLEDNNERIKRFRSEAPYAEITARASDCINLLERGPVDLLFLDHDLGGKTHVSSKNNNTGMGVVRWIRDHKPEIKRIVVHSCNGSAGERMTSELDSLGYEVYRVPFTMLMDPQEFAFFLGCSECN